MNPWEKTTGQVADCTGRLVFAAEIESDPQEEDGFPIRKWPLLPTGQWIEKLSVRRSQGCIMSR